ncbi:MAG: peptide chain release factor N(5)-glutamine methyltransferase [Armatimonadetes bacterium]|nr:peptide chain release factor N(5)-glutamine methyltransferase [Armatimonadota bacterium]
MPAVVTVSDLLEGAIRDFRAAGLDNPRLNAEILVGHVTGFKRVEVLINLDEEVEEETGELLRALVERRSRHEPLQYITAQQEFMGLSLKVDPSVLIPRCDTETLVEAVIERCRLLDSPRLLDVGTGSGAIAISLAHYLPEAHVVATDVSAQALEVARENARAQGVTSRITFLHGSLLEPLTGESSPGLTFDFIVSNLPYIPTADIDSLQPEVCQFEPRVALDGGEDGMTHYRLLAAQSPEFLKEKGSLVCEIGVGQTERITRVLRDAGFVSMETIKDLAKIDRCVVARRDT